MLSQPSELSFVVFAAGGRCPAAFGHGVPEPPIANPLARFAFLLPAKWRALPRSAMHELTAGPQRLRQESDTDPSDRPQADPSIPPAALPAVIRPGTPSQGRSRISDSRIPRRASTPRRAGPAPGRDRKRLPPGGPGGPSPPLPLLLGCADRFSDSCPS